LTRASMLKARDRCGLAEYAHLPHGLPGQARQ
jgi:hypothetical protein